MKELSFFEKIKYYLKTGKLDYEVIRGTPLRELVIKRNTIIRHKIRTNLIVEPTVFCVIEGIVSGQITLREKSELMIIGEVAGSITSQTAVQVQVIGKLVGDITLPNGFLAIEKEAATKGKILAKSLSISTEAIVIGECELKTG